jgi:hypothetical protein
MEERWKTVGILASLVILFVAFFQLLWPYVSPVLVDLNPDPTAEYLRIMWLVSPNGLSALTIMAGCILIAWVVYTGR